MYKKDPLIKLLHNSEYGMGKGTVDKVWYKFSIIDYNKPIVITFAPYKPNSVLHSPEDIEKSDFEELFIWGFDFIKKEGFNVISFDTLKNGLWYRSEYLADYLKNLSEEIYGFPLRLGYGGSMGGYGVSVFSNLLNLNRVLLLNPFSTLNRRLAPFETRFSDFLKNDNWESGFFDGGECNAKGYVIYDPLFHLDVKQANRYKNLEHLRLPGVGHSMPMHLQRLGMLGWIAKSFLHENHIDKNRFYKEARRRRNYSEYYNWLLSKMNRHLTLKRKNIIIYYKYKFFIKEILKGSTPHQQDVLLRMCKNRKVEEMLVNTKNQNIFLFKFSKFLVNRGRYGLSIKILKHLIDQEYRIDKTTELLNTYREELRKKKERKEQILN